MKRLNTLAIVAALAIAGWGSGFDALAAAADRVQAGGYGGTPFVQVQYDGRHDGPYPRRRDRDFAARDCDAPRWDPNVRYLPGQAVWRKGRLYVATDVSASVFNVNSPPEWTPNYWVRARCGRGRFEER